MGCGVAERFFKGGGFSDVNLNLKNIYLTNREKQILS